MPTQGPATTSDSILVPITPSNIPRSYSSCHTDRSANLAATSDSVVITSQVAPPLTRSAGRSGIDPANVATNMPGAPTLQDL